MSRNYLYMNTPKGEPEMPHEEEEWNAIKPSLEKETSGFVAWIGTFDKKINGKDVPYAFVSRSVAEFEDGVLGLFDGFSIYYEDRNLAIDGDASEDMKNLGKALGTNLDFIKIVGRRIIPKMAAECDILYQNFSTFIRAEESFDKIRKYGVRNTFGLGLMREWEAQSDFLRAACRLPGLSWSLNVAGNDKGGM